MASLMVLSDLHSREAMLIGLRQQGVTVVGTRDAEESVGVCVQGAPSAILVDMPALGQECFRSIAQLRLAAPKTPIFALGEWNNALIGLYAERAGATRYLKTPVAIEQLHALIIAPQEANRLN